MRAWEITSDGGVDALELNERLAPSPGPGEIRVRMRASAINYRDLATIEAPGPRGVTYPLVPNSDGAGEVAEVGPGVTGLAVGDRVAGCFFQDWEAGPCSPRAMASALGGALDGVLAEEVVLKAAGALKIPDHLSFAEAACLPCAGLTAWNALTLPRPVAPGETVLLIGTGGVSVFAQQFAAMMGARTVVISSSDAKLGRMKALGAGAGINYRDTPDWSDAVIAASGADGVDRVVEAGGPGTLPRSIAATRIGGAISLMGVLTGVGETINPLDVMRKSILLRGVYVGPRAMFRDMNRAVAAHGMRPVVDLEIPFAEAPEGYRAMRAAGHFGKIVVTI